MNYNKYQQILNITFLAVLIVVGIVLVFASLIIKESGHQIIMAAEGTIEGYRISEPLSLSEITDVTTSSIIWNAVTPLGTNIVIQTAVTDSDSEEPESWDNATNDETIPGIEKGQDLAGKFLWTKQILQAPEGFIHDTPELKLLTVTISMSGEIEGYRISPALDISGPGIVKDSRIFWQANEEFNGIINKVEVKISYNGGFSWSEDWMMVANGTSIPGLEPGTDLSAAKIKTKTSFVGGPDFYPSLENIKIFIETE